MNDSQIHLALTHVPVILSFVGLTLLVISFFRKNDILTKTSFYILTVAALFTFPVYFTGEGTEEIIEELPGVSESIIERHESFARIALSIIMGGGIVSLAGLILYNRRQLVKTIKIVSLVLALGSAGTMAQTAHLGGQIRHTEIRSGFIASSENEGGLETGKEKED